MTRDYAPLSAEFALRSYGRRSVTPLIRRLHRSHKKRIS